jgi:flavodoxin
MPTAIVYYSLSGNTKTAAEFLARELDAALIRIEENTSRSGFFGFMKSGFQAATKRMSKVVGEPWSEAATYDTLYLLTPIWASNGTPAMNAFLDNADFSGKRVTVVTFQADPETKGSEKTHDHIRGIVEAKGGAVEGTHAFHSTNPGKHAGEDHILSQVREVLG